MISYNRMSFGGQNRLATKDSFDTYDGDIKGISKIMVNYTWSPIVWQRGQRLKSNFIQAKWCVLDFENPEVKIHDIIRIFCDVPHVLGTTRNHQLTKGNQPPMD